MPVFKNAYTWNSKKSKRQNNCIHIKAVVHKRVGREPNVQINGCAIVPAQSNI